MENNLFRKQSLDRISTPDELHNYIRVTSPRLWMLLAVIVVLLFGFIIYSASTTIENTMNIKVTLHNYEADEAHEKETGEEYSTWVTGELPLSAIPIVSVGMEIRIGEERGWITYISADDQKIHLIIDMEDDYIPLRDGEYDAVLVLESTPAINYLFQ
jgi:hypothetical protein